MLRSVKKKFVGAALFLSVMGGAVQAQDVFFSSLGYLPFSDAIAVHQSSSDFQPSRFLQNAGIMSVPGVLPSGLFGILAFPEGMHIPSAAGHSSVLTHVYQMSQEDPQDVYLMAATVVSGTDSALFSRGSKEEKRFWSAPAEREFSEKDQEFFNALPKTAEQMSASVNRLLEEEDIQGDVKVIFYQPWARFHSAGKVTRWQSDAWLLLRWKGQIFPLWIRSAVFAEAGGRVSVLSFWGTPAAGRRFSDTVLYGLYGMKEDHQ